MRQTRVPIAALLLMLAATGSAQADAVDDFINAQMTRQRIPGLSVAVVKDGKIVKAEGYGLADRTLKTPATAETVYKIGSVSKQFIATGIMLLVQEGRLNLGDPLSKFLEGAPSTWSGITIHHLLTHTSGIIRESPGFDPFKVQSDAAVLKTAYPLPLRFAPGEKWEYSNSGYFALAEVIHKVTGQPWEDYLSEKVFKRSGMNATYPTNTKQTVPKLASGYSDNDKLLDAPKWTALRPSGAFLSNVLDLAKWDAVLYTEDILSDATRRQMWTPVTLNNGSTYSYGFGWEISSLRDHREVHHGGGIPGFAAHYARFVDDRLTVVVLMNLDDVDPDSIVNGVAALYLPAAATSGNR